MTACHRQFLSTFIVIFSFCFLTFGDALTEEEQNCDSSVKIRTKRLAATTKMPDIENSQNLENSNLDEGGKNLEGDKDLERAYSDLNFENEKDYAKFFDDNDGEEEDSADNNQGFLSSSGGRGTKRQHTRVQKGPKVWDHWGKWGHCSVSCGVGKITRWRHCVSGGCASGEKEAQIKTCTLAAC